MPYHNILHYYINIFFLYMITSATLLRETSARLLMTSSLCLQIVQSDASDFGESRRVVL